MAGKITLFGLAMSFGRHLFIQPYQMLVGPVDKWVGFADAQEMEDVLNRAVRARAVDQR